MDYCSVINGLVPPLDHLPSRKISSCTWKWSEPQTLTNCMWLKVGYYPGPWHTLVPKRSGDRYHCDLQILITKDYWHKQNLKDRKKEMFIRGPDSVLLTYTNQCWGNSASHITTMVPQLNNWWCTDPPANEPNSLISILGLNRWLGGQTQLCQSLRFEHPQHVHSGKGFMHTRSQWTQKDHQS